MGDEKMETTRKHPPDRFGQKVKAYPLDESGPKVGFYIDSAGDGKDNVQVGETIVQLAYREPADYDEAGPNGTYCNA